MIDLAQGDFLLWRPQCWESQVSYASSYSDTMNKV